MTRRIDYLDDPKAPKPNSLKPSANAVVLNLNLGALPHALFMEQIRRFAREVLPKLKAHEVTVQVSVDGDEATHDRFRLFKSGKPTLGVIKPNITELARQEVDFNLRAVMTRENTDPRAVTDGLRRLGADRVSFEVVATDDPETRLTGEDWEAKGVAPDVAVPADQALDEALKRIAAAGVRI